MTTDLYGPLALNAFQAAVVGDRTVEIPAGTLGLRPGTKLPVTRNGYYFSGAGMGDYICYMPALRWIARNCPWIDGSVWAPAYFLDFAKNIMQEWNWKVYESSQVKNVGTKIPGLFLTGPGLTYQGQTNHQLYNGTGGHLVRIGFAYMANRTPRSDESPECEYPEIVLDDVTKLKLKTKFSLPRGEYFVIAPGALSDNRTVPGAYWNPIIDYIRELGFKVVFLGKTEMSKTTRVVRPEGLDWHKGIDLWDKTSMLEAAYIMENSLGLLNHDTGLSHLAACTHANIITSFGSVEPYERRPLRPWSRGVWHEISPALEKVPCAGCQTHVKKLQSHSFKYCIHQRANGEQDLLCVDDVFSDGGVKFRWAIDEILKTAFKAGAQR